MRIEVHGRDSWTVHGARLLLEQLGISFELAGDAPGGPGILLSASVDNAGPNSRAMAIAVGPWSQEGRTVAGAVVSYEGTSAYFPGTAVVPHDADQAIVLARFASGEPAIVQRGSTVHIFPDFFEYVAKATTVRQYDETFAESFSWDQFRQILLRLLERISDQVGAPLARLWYYPSARYTNSVTYTTDVDHRLAWELVKGLGKASAGKARWGRYLPGGLQRLLALGAGHRFYGEGLYHRPFMSAGGALLGQIFKRLRLSLPLSWYPASINQVYVAGMPITAFLRPSEFQKEETLASFRFREGYRPEHLSSMEVALHFGGTIGLYLGVWIRDPYDVDVFREGIPPQIACFRRDTGKPVFGARLHHVFGFNQEMFWYLDQAPEILYDSSLFGTIGGVSTRWNPAGVSLPYFPILYTDRNLQGEPKRAGFVEIPAIAYETADLPFDAAARNNSAIVVSEHPDRVKSPIVQRFLAEAERHRGSWWRVTLEELARWWKTRQGVGLNLRGDALGISADGVAAEPRLCVVVYPAGARPRLPQGWRLMEEQVEGGRLYLDLAPESRSADPVATER